MASVLASGPNISLGFGIANQAVPDNIGYTLAAQGIQRAAQERARQAAAKKKAEDDIKDIGIKPPVVHPLDQPEIDKATKEFGKYAFDQTKSSNPDGYYNVKAKANEYASQANSAVERAKYYGTIEKAMEQDKATGTMSPEARDAFDAFRAGDREKLSKIKDPTRRFIYDEKSGVPVYRPVPNVKTDAVESSMVKNPEYRTSVSAFQNKEYHNPKGGIEIFNVDRMPETKAEAADIQAKFGINTPLPTLEDQRDLLMQSPDFTERKAVELINSGGLPKDFYDRSPDAQQQLLSKSIYKDLQAKNGAKITRNVQNPNAPQKDNSIDVNSALEKTVEYKTFSGEKFDAIGSAALPKPVKSAIPSTQIHGAMNSNTLKQVNLKGVAPIWSISAPQIFLVDKKSGQPVDKVTKQKLEDAGKLNGSDYSYKILTYANGEEETPGTLSEAQKKEISGVFFPLDVTRPALQKSGVDIKPYEKKVSELNSGLSGGSNVEVKSETSAKKYVPQKGDVDGGYVFQGGDPADAKNWKKK